MKKAVLIVGVIGMVLSLCVVSVSVGLHLANPRNISFEEALAGIIPGGLCCSLFAVLAVVGLVLVLMRPSVEAATKKRQREDDEEERDEADA